MNVDRSSLGDGIRANSTTNKSVESRAFGGRVRSLGEPVGVRALSVGRAKEQIILFDIL